MSTHTPKRVLIADDEALVMNMIQGELESIGLEVVGKASDGLRVVTLTRELRPDVVLMDIAMPEQDGLTAAALIQQECPTPVVVLSAHEGVQDIARASAAGVGAFLVKPPRASDLERAIAIAVARHADLMELRRVNAELKQAMAEIRTLGGLLPICCSCKKIRDDKGYWNQIETYISAHTDTRFTHSYCPDCLKKYFPGFVPSVPSQNPTQGA
jgi:two-component system, response regulator PdtaR